MDMQDKPKTLEIKHKKFKETNILETGHLVNDIGLFVLDLCDGTHTVEYIVKTISEEYEIKFDEVKEDVLNFLEDLRSEELIE